MNPWILIIVVLYSSLQVSTAQQCTVAAPSDCGFAGITEEQCVEQGCCYSPQGENSVTPWCFRPANTYELSFIENMKTGMRGILELRSDSAASTYGDSIKNLAMEMIYESVDTFRIRITDKDNERYEVPQSMVGRPTPKDIKPMDANNLNYEVEYTHKPFTFEVKRKADGVSLFKLSSDMLFKDQFIQFSTWTDDTAKTYGVGESTRMEQALQPGTTKTLWAVDIPAASMYNNLYGSYPYYVQLVRGSAHGAMLMSSNGMDVVLAQNSITFKVLGGMIDLYIFSGPTPNAVVQQYTSIVGRPMMVPYWSLGFHNCKYGYTSTAQVEEVVKGYQDAGIPLDTQWMDIDYMEAYRDFTWDPTNFNEKDTAAFVDNLHSQGLHFVPIIDPGIMVFDNYPAFEDGQKKDLWVKGLDGQPYLGQVWPGPVYFPDFFNPATQDYWTQQVQSVWDGVKVDGLWIDMNEVSNFCNVDGTGQVCKNVDPSNCPTGNIDTQTTCCLQCSEIDGNNKYDFPPYAIKNALGNIGTKTMPPSAYHYNNISHYDVHNLYGLSEQIATNKALTEIRGERPFLLTRSSFLSSGVHTAKWTGDNQATWDDLKSSIVSIADFSLFGVPMIGADICGFIGNTTEELCARWAEVGAFSPFSRNHNSLGEADQEFYLWDSVTAAAKNALGIRYQLLPHMYTLFYLAHTQGMTVQRPLWMNFPEDGAAADSEYQFMLGNEVMVVPVVEEGQTSVDGYFPQGQLWYDFSSLTLSVDSSAAGLTKTLDTPLESVNVFVRGGSVLPMQEAKMTTTEARTTPFTLTIALCNNNGAFGSLFFDDGVQVDLKQYLSVDYQAKDGALTATVSHDSLRATVPTIGTIRISGKDQAIASTVALNGAPLDSTNWSMDAATGVLTINLGTSISIKDAFSLTWE